MLTLIFTLLLSSGTMPDRQRMPRQFEQKTIKPIVPINEPFCQIRNKTREKVLPVHRD